MKIVYILGLTILLYKSGIYPQWNNQNPVPDGNHLLSTFFINDNTGWIVGSEGFIKKTTNAGLDWIQQNSGTTLTLKSIQFINQNIGWICGEGGLIIKTTNGGQTWFQLISGTTEILTDLQFCNLNIGYSVGYNGTILKTTDGGLSWITQSSRTTNNLFSVDFVDAVFGYAVGGAMRFLKTTDGGLNWIVSTLDLGPATMLNCVDFMNVNVGFVGSDYGPMGNYGAINKTTDGGETWSSIGWLRLISERDSVKHLNDNPFNTQEGIRSIYFKDSINGYAVGGTYDGWNRHIYTTTDAGTTWQSKYGYSEQTGLLSIFVNSSGKGWAVGYYGVIYLSEDGGDSWSQILSGSQLPNGYTGDWITSVFMINDSLGWAAGKRKGIWYYNIIMKTTNGGKIWVTNAELDFTVTGPDANIFFLDENIGWITFNGYFIFKTNDGGEHWINLGSAGSEIFFINQDTGWSASMPPGIRKSTDGGTNWIQKSSVNSSSIFFSDDFKGWAVGTEGSILKSTNGGETWVSKLSGTTLNLNSVRFHDNNVGMCVGNSGIVLLATDGGENWHSQNVGTTAALNSVLFTNASTIWIAGSSGTIINSTDLGNNWISYDGVGEVNIASIYFTNENTGWACGDNNIFKYESGITPVELFSFTANVKNKTVILNWQTATEINNFGFEIERRTVVGDWNNIGFVEGHGNSSSPIFYSYIDNNPLDGNKYLYRLKQVDLNGKLEYSNEIEVEMNLGNYVLYQNYPNPFNPSTKIKYIIPNESEVVIKIYDILGKEVAILVNEKKDSGTYELELNANNLSSGTYMYRIIAGDFVETKKMLLLH